MKTYGETYLEHCLYFPMTTYFLSQSLYRLKDVVYHSQKKSSDLIDALETANIFRKTIKDILNPERLEKHTHFNGNF